GLGALRLGADLAIVEACDQRARLDPLSFREGQVHDAGVQLAHDLDVLVGLDVAEGPELVAHDARVDLCDLDRHGWHLETATTTTALLAARRNACEEQRTAQDHGAGVPDAMHFETGEWSHDG